jgi:hypothetical protein
MESHGMDGRQLLIRSSTCEQITNFDSLFTPNPCATADISPSRSSIVRGKSLRALHHNARFLAFGRLGSRMDTRFQHGHPFWRVARFQIRYRFGNICGRPAFRVQDDRCVFFHPFDFTPPDWYSSSFGSLSIGLEARFIMPLRESEICADETRTHTPLPSAARTRLVSCDGNEACIFR